MKLGWNGEAGKAVVLVVFGPFLDVFWWFGGGFS